jgi:selenocysteine lyase/cysteine desulfurase
MILQGWRFGMSTPLKNFQKQKRLQNPRVQKLASIQGGHMIFDTSLVRQQFPSLNRPAIFLDNPAGTQISKQSLDRINRYLLEHNANHEGMFETSRQSDEVLHEAHAAMADFLNASRPEEIIFGNNMTTLTLHISRSLARNLQAGDNILVTRLDHDANISPWMLVAEDKGCNLIWVDIDVEEGSLDLDDFAKVLERKPKIAAFGYASNLLGTVNPVKKLTKMAHEAGALVYIDAVQYAPHGPIDVQDIDCDFLVCSSYKYSEPQITRHVQFHGSPGHRKDKTVTIWNQIPKWVMAYNQCLSPITFSEYIQ